MSGLILKIMSRQIELIALFEPLQWQIAPWQDLSLIVLLTGSAGGGKSRLAAEKLHGYCLRYPGTMALMLRKIRQSMTNSTVLFMERTVIGDDSRVKHFPSKLRFEYDNGSVLAYGGMANEEQREQVRSIGATGGVDIAWMEEATGFTEDDFNEVLPRMRATVAPWRQVILSTNPDAPTHWIKRRLIDGGEAKTYYSSALDNPHNPPEYRDTLAALTGVLGERLREGKWVQAEGAVYDIYDAQHHLIDWFEPPAAWRRIRAVDFGFTNPFVCQWWALDHDDRMYLYREIYHTRRIVEDHARQIVELSRGEDIEATVCDHDAEDRATLERYGIPTIPAYKAVSQGLQAVTNRLRIAGDGRPRLYIMRGALVETDRALEQRKKPTCTMEEFPAYVWPKARGGQEVKEQPVKEDDHGMDTTRYAVTYVDVKVGSFVG